MNHDATQLRSELATLMPTFMAEGDGVQPTAIPELELMRESAPSTPFARVYEPVLAIIAQGEKEALLGGQSYRYGAGDFLLISVDLVVSGFVTQATPNKPYLGFKLTLDPVKLSSMLPEIPTTGAKVKLPAKGLLVGEADAALLECALRLLQLLETPRDIAFLAPLVLREIYYRLFMGEQGQALRQIATPGSAVQRVTEVVKLIKEDLSAPLQIEVMAETANMSLSTFHRRFKEVTSLSPLQYQKQYRLLEARRLMLAEQADATSASYRVGYESPSQFSREYARMFGAPPKRDIERLLLV